jgi:hypothetical protein
MTKRDHCPECGAVLSDPSDHSDPARRRYFAILRETFDSLPDHWRQICPSSEHLRAYCLVQVGHCDTTVTDCGSKAAAERVAALARGMDSFAVVKISGPCVVVAKARSQRKRVQPKREFLDCAELVYAELEKMVGTNVREAA